MVGVLEAHGGQYVHGGGRPQQAGVIEHIVDGPHRRQDVGHRATAKQSHSGDDKDFGPAPEAKGQSCGSPIPLAVH
eukprot:1604375-Pyramimonas_sp.AAC.2